MSNLDETPKPEEETAVKSPVGALTDSSSNEPASQSADLTIPKITVRFRPMGGTKRLQTTMFKVSSEHEFSTLVTFLRRKLNFAPQNSLFCYINASFSPALDARLEDLSQAYSVEGVLNVYYCATVAFG